MKFEIDAFIPSQQELLKELGLGEDGYVQRVVDETFMHYMKLKMPIKDYGLVNNTRNPKGGLVTVEEAYAHYQNEGILYVDPDYKVGAFYSPSYGYWSRPKVKKIPSTRKLEYHSGANRGAHFVERTASENFNDIVSAAQQALDQRRNR